jgi:hypothetical protein
VRQRNGEDAQRFFDLWIPLENAYFASLRGSFRFGMTL